MTSKSRRKSIKVLPWRKLTLSEDSDPLDHVCGYHSVTPVGRYLYVLGSFPLRIDRYTHIALHRFDLYEKKWAEVRFHTGPKQRYGHTATLVDDKLYLFGGKKRGFSSDLYAYDLCLNAWTLCAVESKPPGHFVHTAHYSEELRTLFVLCGRTDYSKSSRRVYAYGMNTNQWVQCAAKGNAPQRRSHSSCKVGMKIFVSGGQMHRGEVDPKAMHVFDFSQGVHLCTWSTVAMEGQLNRPVHGGAMFYVSEGRFLVLGEHPGMGNKEPAFMGLYDLNKLSITAIRPEGSGKVQTTANCPKPRRKFGYVRLHNRILVFGGYQASMDPIYEVDISAL